MSIRKIVSTVAVAAVIAFAGVSIVQAEDALPREGFVSTSAVKIGPKHIVMSDGDARLEDGVFADDEMETAFMSGVPQHVLDTLEVH